MMKSGRNNNGHKTTRRSSLGKMLSGFLAVSTAVTMLGGNTVFFADETAAGNYALAGEGSGEDVTIHFGDDADQEINIHVNPATEAEETDEQKRCNLMGVTLTLRKMKYFHIEIHING